MLIRPLTIRDFQNLRTPVTSMRRTVVQSIVRNRSAWHSTPVTHYRDGMRLYTGFHSAREGVEAWRRQGSSFVVDDYPALVFTAGATCLVVTELDTSTPFRGWEPPPNLANQSDPLLGSQIVEIFGQQFAGSRVSGWSVDRSDSTVVFGTAHPAAFEYVHGSRPLERHESWAVIAGQMEYETYASGVKSTHVKPVLDALSSLIPFDLGKPRVRVWKLARTLNVTPDEIVEELEKLLGRPNFGSQTGVEPVVASYIGRQVNMRRDALGGGEKHV